MAAFPPPQLQPQKKSSALQLERVWPLFKSSWMPWTALSGIHFVAMVGFGWYVAALNTSPDPLARYSVSAAYTVLFAFITFHVWHALTFPFALRQIDGRPRSLAIWDWILLAGMGLLTAFMVALGYCCCYAPGIWAEGMTSELFGHVSDGKQPRFGTSRESPWLRGLLMHSMDGFLIAVTFAGLVGYIVGAPLYVLSRALHYRTENPLEPTGSPKT